MFRLKFEKQFITRHGKRRKPRRRRGVQVVYRNLVREVPRVIEREVIREVPREIIREVPREIIREVPREVSILAERTSKDEIYALDRRGVVYSLGEGELFKVPLEYSGVALAVHPDGDLAYVGELHGVIYEVSLSERGLTGKSIRIETPTINVLLTMAFIGRVLYAMVVYNSDVHLYMIDPSNRTAGDCGKIYDGGPPLDFEYDIFGMVWDGEQVIVTCFDSRPIGGTYRSLITTLDPTIPAINSTAKALRAVLSPSEEERPTDKEFIIKGIAYLSGQYYVGSLEYQTHENRLYLLDPVQATLTPAGLIFPQFSDMYFDIS